MKSKGLGVYDDNHKILFVTTTECAMKVPGVSNTETLRLCKPLEGELTFDVLNIAIFTGMEVDGFQKTKYGSTPVLQLATIVDEQMRKVVTTATLNIRND